MLHHEYEPPPAETKGNEPHFIVGQDTHGFWLAIESHNLVGGIFKSREDALHFVDFETGHRLGAIEMSSEPLQFRF
jgi:hypothetical protein